MKKYLRLHPKDQVVIALKDFSPGEKIHRVTIKTSIPRWHKIAVAPVNKGASVLKYGQVIGFATQPIGPGEWVHIHNLNVGRLSDPTSDDLATEIPPDPIPIPDRYFLGFRRPDGRAATRNYILLASTVDCANHAVEAALRELNCEKSFLLRRYPNVDGVIGMTHASGCGLAALSEAHLRQNRTIAGFLNHPNAADRLVVGLGCEKGSPDLIFNSHPCASLKTFQNPANENPPVFMIQNEGGTQKTVDKIIDYILKVLPEINRMRRELIPASELILATQCGGSNALSGITANPAIGIASDLLVACGGTSFFAETTETFGAGHLLTRRARTKEIAQKYLDKIVWWEKHLKFHGAHFDNNPTPGNKEGGLTTIAEKSLGSIAKGGNTALCGVVDYAEPVKGPGLFFMNTPAYDPVSCTGQTAGGALVGIFSTGQGSCFGGLLTPWIKVVSHTEVFDKMIDMEINAGAILDGIPLETVGRQIFEQVLAVASGARTYSEKMNITVFNVWNTGVTT
jgi:altronate hydrolase